MEKTLEKLLDKGVDIGIKIMGLVVILFIGFKLIKLIMNILNKGKLFEKLDKSAKSFINSFINIALKIILFMTAFSYLGIPMTSMIALIGSCGLALGLALQGGLSNIAGGLMILVFKPFKVGDYIDNHSDSGTVENISVFHTTIVTPDNRIVVIPNGPLCNSTIINYSTKNKRRLDLTFQVSYETNIDRVKIIVNKIIKAHKLILQDEEQLVRLCEQGTSSLNFSVKVWVKPEDYWNVFYDLQEQVKEEFDKSKIEIPYQKIDVNLKK